MTWRSLSMTRNPCLAMSTSREGDTSVEDDPAVDVERLPGDVSRPRRRQEDGERGDVLGVVGPPERNAGVPAALHLFHGDALLAGAVLQIVVRQRGDGRPRADGVDVDV